MEVFQKVFIANPGLGNKEELAIENIKSALPPQTKEKMFLLLLLPFIVTVRVVHVSGQLPCTADGHLAGHCTTNPGDCVGFFFTPSSPCETGQVLKCASVDF